MTELNIEYTHGTKEMGIKVKNSSRLPLYCQAHRRYDGVIVYATWSGYMKFHLDGTVTLNTGDGEKQVLGLKWETVCS